MRIGGYAVFIVTVAALLCGCEEKICRDCDEDDVLRPPLGAAFSAGNGEVTFFDLVTLEIVSVEQMEDGYSLSAEFAQTGAFLFAAESLSDAVHLYSLPRFELHSRLTNAGVPIDLHASRDAQQLYVLSENANFRRIDVSESSHVDTVEVGLDPRRMTLREGERNEMWIACRSDSSVYILNLHNLNELDTLKFSSIPTDIAFSPLGERAYVALQGGWGIDVFDDRQFLYTLDGGPGPMDLAMNPDGSLLAGADSTLGEVRIWNLNTGLHWNLPVGARAARVRFSDDRRSLFVISSAENHVLRIEVGTGDPFITDTISVPATLRELVLWERLP